MRVVATLARAVTPILAVSPPGIVDFGAVQLASSGEQVFVVLNTGAGTLFGEAHFAAGGDADFTLLDEDGTQVPAIGYAIEAEAISTVRVRFSPSEAGFRTAVLEFTGAGLQSRTLNGIGADLTVTPADGLEFPETEVGMNAELEFIVANAGSSPISGDPTLPAGAPNFTLRDQGEDVDSIAYSLNPGGRRGSRFVSSPKPPETSPARPASAGGPGRRAPSPERRSLLAPSDARVRGIPRRAIRRRLDLVELRVGSAPRHQLRVVTHLDHACPVHHDDPVGHADGAEAVGDEERDAPVGAGVARGGGIALEERVLGFGVEGRGRLVEDQEQGVRRA